MKVHPDRVGDEEKEDATVKFQILGRVYAILSDSEKRKIYDETGDLCRIQMIQSAFLTQFCSLLPGNTDGEVLDKDVNWADLWKLLFKKVTTKDIVDFERKYKGSEEEREDLKQLYLRYKGDMDKIMSFVLCATNDDEPRLRDFLQELIDSKDLPAYKAFTGESEKKKANRKRKADREAKMADKMAKDLGLNTTGEGYESVSTSTN